jgi:hypothetical protein
MQITPAVQQTYLQEVDHLLLRRHRLAPFPFTNLQLARMFFSREEWLRVAWLLKSDAKAVLWQHNTVKTNPIDGMKFIFQLPAESGLRIPCHQEELQPLNWDAEVAPHFRAWVEAQRKLAEENLATYRLVSMVIQGSSTWLQAKKAWPELVQFNHTLDELVNGHKPSWYRRSRSIPNLRDTDAALARDLEGRVRVELDRGARRAQQILLQASLMPALDDASQDGETPPEKAWYRYATRPLYVMHSTHLNSARQSY